MSKKQQKKTKKKLVKRAATIIKSPSSAHVFDNAIFGHANILAIQELTRKQQAIDLCEELIEHLKSIPFKQAWTTDVKPFAAFRIVNGRQDPLDSKFTFGAGGRVNIGMSQIVPDIPSLNAVGGIYASLDFATAKAEFESGGIPMGPHSMAYNLTCSKASISIVDYDLALQDLDSQINEIALSLEVAAIPTMACWKYQKYPLVSQIIGNWLLNRPNESKPDVVSFSSTKRLNGKNCFIAEPSDWSFKSFQP